MDVIISARSKTQNDTNYTKLEQHGLHAAITTGYGSGSSHDPMKAKITITNEQDTAWSGVIHVELVCAWMEPRFFLPAFMYGRNRGEAPQNVPNEFPRLRPGNPSRPSSSWWMVRSDRLSHPAAFVYDNGKIYGLCASPYIVVQDGIKQQWTPELNGEFFQYSGYTCSLDKGTIGYTLGYENAPLHFIKSRLVKERAPLEHNCFEISANESIDISLDLYTYDADSELGINAALEAIYYKYYENPRAGSDIRTAVADLSTAVYEDAWLPEERAYSTFVYEDRNTGEHWYNKIISISWTDGLSVATPVLMSALRLGHEKMREQAILCIEHIVHHSLNRSSGLPYEAYNNGQWSNKGWWFDGMRTPGHSAYLAAQAVYYILRAYDFELRMRGVRHDEWMSFSRDVINQLEKTKNTDGEYPTILSERTGAGLEYDAFSGAWCMAALAYYSWLNSDVSHMDSLRQSENHYYEAYLKRMECYGAPLDADKAPDSEGILAYIKAVRYMHALTGEELFLDHMRDAICYEFSFKFCYNSPVEIPPLSRIKWSSCGGSVTSVANPHIHPMSSNVVDELLYYVMQRDDSYVRQRMQDTVSWGCQTYNRYDKEFDHGKKGWMSERFCHSEGLVTETYADGSPASTWFCLMPWASGSILDGLAGDYWDFKTDN